MKRWLGAELLDSVSYSEFGLRRASLNRFQIMGYVLYIDRNVANPEHNRSAKILDAQLATLFKFVVQAE